MWGKWDVVGFIICAILLVIAVYVVGGLLFASFEANSQAIFSPIPRPTLPAETPSYEVFIPIVNQHNLTPTVTPRPTLEG